MAFIARLIQGAGWLWIATGIASQVFDFGDISWFPGIILLFISRVMRAQTRTLPQPERQQREKPEEPAAPPVPERPLNTERRQEPVRKSPPPAPEEVLEPEIVIEPVQPPRPVAAERKPVVTEWETIEIPEPTLETSERSVKSSAEMIAEARRRWDRRR